MTIEYRAIGSAPSCVLIQPTARHEAPGIEEELCAIAEATGKSYVMALVHVDGPEDFPGRKGGEVRGTDAQVHH